MHENHGLVSRVQGLVYRAQRRPLINKPPPFIRGLNIRIPIIVPIKGRGFINRVSGPRIKDLRFRLIRGGFLASTLVDAVRLHFISQAKEPCSLLLAKE